MKANEIAEKSLALITGDRKEAYGDVVDGLQRAAHAWNGFLAGIGKATAKPLTPHDVGQMMVCFKQMRSYTGPYRPDNSIDQVGWSAIAGEAAAREATAKDENR